MKRYKCDYCKEITITLEKDSTSQKIWCSSCQSFVDKENIKEIFI